MPPPSSLLPFDLGNLDLTSPSFRTWLAEARARKLALDILHKPLILIGAGSYLALDFVAHITAKGRVIALVDNARAGQALGDIPYIGDAALNDLLATTPDAMGILCCGSENAINHFTRLWGERPQPLLSYFEVISLLPEVATANYWFVPAFSDPDQIVDLHAKASQVFSDTLSRKTLDAIMLYRLTWDIRHIAHIAKPEKAIYFEPDVMPLTDHEILVDGGAYDGDTIRDFISKTGGRYDHAHAFEIDPVNADLFTGKMQHAQRVSLHRVGLWNASAEMGIEQRIDNGSRVSQNATVTVPLDAMDNMDLGKVSLIKLDIEGAENQALQGAQNLIAKHKPKLAICAYHKADDFLTILDTLSDLRDDYRLTLRHYSPIIFDSVIYAI
jgi:FkbM family methyltransferase